MRLLRLTTRKDNAEFESSFNDNLVLQPYSKVAVQSAAINTLPQFIRVTSVNNGLKVQIKVGYDRNINLEERDYESGQILELLDDLTKKLNSSMNYDFSPGGDTVQKVFGIQWKAEIIDNRVNIQYKIGVANNYFFPTGANNNWTKKNITFSGNGANLTVSSAQAATANASNYSILPFSLSKGNGYARCRIKVLETETNAGFIIGLSNSTDIINAASNIDLTKIKYGVHVKFDGAQRGAQAIKNGVNVGSFGNLENYSSGGATNDFVGVWRNGDKIEINRWGHDGADYVQNVLFSEDSTPGEDLFPVLVFFGGQVKTKINGIRITPSPYGRQPLPRASDGTLESTPPQQPNPNQTDKNFIFFDSVDLPIFLGYQFQRLPNNNQDFFEYGAGRPNAIQFEAQRKYLIPQSADAMLIQLNNLSIESYDSFSNTLFPSGGQRKNLLAVIPQTSTTGNIVYEPPYPTFISLNNKEPIYLRNINLKVLREDYSEIFIIGMGSIVLLIDE